MTGYLVVVSCGSQKIWKRLPNAGPTAARDAYNSPVFKRSREYAEHFGERWMILSAKYGLVDPGFVIPQDYNVSFYSVGAISDAALKSQIREQKLGLFGTCGLVGSDMYWQRLKLAFDECRTVLRHVNGSTGYPPKLLQLLNDLIASGSPFRSPV